MEHRWIKGREKAQLLEKLDRVEVSEALEKITKEVAKDEDRALVEKIESIIENNETPIATESPIEEIKQSQAEETTEEVPTEDEKNTLICFLMTPKTSMLIGLWVSSILNKKIIATLGLVSGGY